MLVDDSEDYRALLRLALRLDGRFEVVGEASSGEAALRDVAQAEPDLVVLDLLMPGMDGLEVHRLLRERVPGVGVAFLSGFPSAAAAGASELPASLYVNKSMPVDELLDALAQLAANKAA
jgi:two-component system, NarL family, response regulator LiaR